VKGKVTMSQFNRFDICDAYYLFASHWHSGQFSETYRIFGRLHAIRYKPGMLLQLETAEPEVKAIYGSLVKKHYPGECGWKRRLKK